MFKFKQFSIDQTGCAMKINTDGVLLGALAEADNPAAVLDIGTGTGVIALMLAQRFAAAKIDAVEIDESAAKTAEKNAGNSIFSAKIEVFMSDFDAFLKQNAQKKYDLIVSNPPFYINSLKSPKNETTLAKHAGEGFFERLVKGVSKRLSDTGLFWLVLPSQAAEIVDVLAESHGLHLYKNIGIRSFNSDLPHRRIMALGLHSAKAQHKEFVIYEEPGKYSAQYISALKPFFIVF